MERRAIAKRERVGTTPLVDGRIEDSENPVVPCVTETIHPKFAHTDKKLQLPGTNRSTSRPKAITSVIYMCPSP